MVAEPLTTEQRLDLITALSAAAAGNYNPGELPRLLNQAARALSDQVMTMKATTPIDAPAVARRVSDNLHCSLCGASIERQCPGPATPEPRDVKGAEA